MLQGCSDLGNKGNHFCLHEKGWERNVSLLCVSSSITVYKHLIWDPLLVPTPRAQRWVGDGFHLFQDISSWENTRVFEMVLQLHIANRWCLVIKNPPANAGDVGDMGLNPGSGRSLGGGPGNWLQSSCLFISCKPPDSDSECFAGTNSSL